MNQVAAAYDAVADEYDSSYRQKKSLAEDKIVLNLLRPLISKSWRIEDLGCGTGFLLDHLSLTPGRYHGVDISPGMIARARAKHPVHSFDIGNIGDLKLPSGSMDLVVSLFGPFSYAKLDAFAELYRILVPGGRFLVMLLGQRYRDRSTYILNRAGIDVPKQLYTVAEAQAMFAAFDDVRIRGLSCLVDVLPEALPQRFFDLFLRAEHSTLGRLIPNRHYFLIVTGRKHDSAMRRRRDWEPGSLA